MTRLWEISPLWQKKQSFEKIRVYLVFGKLLNLFWQINYAIGHIYIVVNGQILNKHLSICLTDRK